MSDGYTCCHCSTWYEYDDPRFRFWLTNRAGENLDGRDGRAKSSLGWFAHCVDEVACAARKANMHAGVHREQLRIT